MRRRSYNFTLFQVLLCLVIIGLTIALFFKSNELTILFPIVFGLATFLALLHAFEGLIYNRNRVVNKTRAFLYVIAALVLGFFTFFSAKAVM